MEQVYKLGFWTRFFYGLLAMGMIGFSIFLFSEYNPANGPYILIIPIFFIVFSAFLLINLSKKQLILSADKIKYRWLFFEKELAVDDVRGYRILGNKEICIEPVSSSSSKIVIRNYIDLQNSVEVSQWLKDNFKDLDAEDLKNEKESLLQNSLLGFTEQEREKKIKNARQIAIAYNVWGAVLGVVCLIFENKGTTIALLIYPLLGVLLIFSSKGLIKFLSNRKRSVYAYVALGIFIPGMFMIFRCINEHHIFQVHNLWLPAFSCAFFLFILLILRGLNRSVESIVGQILVMIIVCCLYGFGSTLLVNSVFDKSIPKTFNAVVLDHSISHGKSTSYYLTLSTWGTEKEEDKVSVGKTFYENTLIGDTVKISLKEGLLHIPYFDLEH